MFHRNRVQGLLFLVIILYSKNIKILEVLCVNSN